MNSERIARKDKNGGLVCRKPQVSSYGKSWDNRLLELCLQGDADAWYEFVHHFQPLIAAVIVKTLRRGTDANPAVVDDLVQETYVKLCMNHCKALREFTCRHDHALAGFLKVVASNLTQDYLRCRLSQRQGSGKGEDALENVISTSGSAAISVEAVEQQTVLHAVEQSLQSQCSEPNFSRDRRIFWLYYRDGFTAKAISQEPGIGLSVKGVESALFRVTELLRAKLRPRPVESGRRRVAG